MQIDPQTKCKRCSADQKDWCKNVYQINDDYFCCTTCWVLHLVDEKIKKHIEEHHKE